MNRVSPTGRGFGSVRTSGAIPPTALRLWAPPVHEATGGYAVRSPLPIRRYSSSSSFSLLFVCAMMLLIFCLVTIWVSVLNPALP